MSRTTSDEVKSVQPELLMVRAGAGAGKTTELVNRVLSLARHYLKTEKRLPHLVVTTFTRKATQELKERLLSEALKLSDADLVRFVQSPSHLHISTIHGVLSLYLFRYGVKIGLGPQFSIIDSTSEVKLIKKAIKRYLKKDQDLYKIDLLLEELNLKNLITSLQTYFEQRFIVGHKINFFNDQDLKKSNAHKTLEWAEKANELVNHTENIQDGKNWPEYISFLKNCIVKINQSQGMDFQSIISFSENKPDTKVKKGTDEFVKELKTEVHKLADDFFDRKWVFEESYIQKHKEVCFAFQSLAESLFTDLFSEKVSASTLTMSDLENFSLWLAQNNPQTAEQFSEEWDYWLVDEYQDTSPKQVEILNKLIGHRNSFTVGDPQQSIYLFRGARAEVFLQKEKDVLNLKGQTLKKMENYRSRPELLHFFNHFFQHYDSRQFQPMIATDKNLVNELKNTPAAYFIQADKTLEDSDLLSAIERITELLQSGTRAEEICVLARSNQVLNRFSKLCFQYHIPVQLHAGSGFRGRREILDALMLLKFLVNSHDNVNLVGLLRTPWFRIHDAEISRVANISQNSYWQVLQKELIENSVVIRLIKLKKLTEEIGFVQAWKQGLVQSGILDFSYSLDPSGRREANLMKLISDLSMKERLPGFRILDFIYDEEISSMSDTEVAGESDAVPVISPDRVNLMTVHASKGLQFEHVLLIGVGNKPPQTRSNFFMYHETDMKFSISLVDSDSGKLLTSTVGEEIRTTKSDREKQEMARVLYVALTRAKYSIFLSWQTEIKGSWSSQMWKPTEGLVQHDLFHTSFISNHRPEIKKMERNVPQIKKLRTKLSEKKEENKSRSVTEILAADLNKIKFHKSESQKRIELVQKGVDIHRIFESICYRNEIPKPKTANEQSVHHFMQTDNGKKLLQWMSDGNPEWGFCVVQDDIWIQGQIDLWCRADDGQVYIVDYKTGSKAYLSKAQEQLNLYAWALRKMKKIQPNDKVHLVVIYPLENEMIFEKADPDYIPSPLRVSSPSH